MFNVSYAITISLLYYLAIMTQLRKWLKNFPMSFLKCNLVSHQQMFVRKFNHMEFIGINLHLNRLVTGNDSNILFKDTTQPSYIFMRLYLLLWKLLDPQLWSNAHLRIIKIHHVPSMKHKPIIDNHYLYTQLLISCYHFWHKKWMVMCTTIVLQYLSKLEHFKIFGLLLQLGENK